MRPDLERERNGYIHAFLLKHIDSWVTDIYCHKVFEISEESPDKVPYKLYANFEKLKSNGDILAIQIQRGLRLIGGNAPLDLSLCFGRDFNSYDLAKLVKLVPANRNV